MNKLTKQELLASWKDWEARAQIKGWDFSPIEGLFEGESHLPWDYEALIRERLRPTDRLLDMDTGGGEFLLSLGHLPLLTAATEGWPPNVALCEKKLLPLGIDFYEAQAHGRLPFADASFDVIINRHGAYLAKEIYRLLKPNGLFITQQVGDRNNQELIQQMLPDLPAKTLNHHLATAVAAFQKAGFTIELQAEAFDQLRFYDIGALVWYMTVISWEFPGFSVERCQEQLLNAQEILTDKGKIESRAHRFLLCARKSQSRSVAF